jgi:NADH:ubiquinone oxidoreductase subunit 5 (subunit L)/multisubunit Na+/H+ antiporter MnhA subunit
MLNHGVSTGALFMLVGMLSDRRHTRLIAEFGGLKAVMPRFVAAFFLITLSSIALPGMNGFVGEFLILVGAFQWSWKFAALAASGVILSAVYMLWMFQRVNYGEITNEKNRSMKDLTPREWALMIPSIAMAIVMGMFPGPFLRPMERSVNKVIERVTTPRTASVAPPGQSEPSGPHFSLLVGPHPHSRGLAPSRSAAAAGAADSAPLQTSTSSQHDHSLRLRGAAGGRYGARGGGAPRAVSNAGSQLVTTRMPDSSDHD